ncbi:YfhO family protein [Enorma sp.]|uniref:YfhO family protein n=1 Tax=Enorma sp. TaxID=1920692 RepID=UPI0025C3EB61|nr:YfhO family protein [Enorma sp.]
MDKDIERIDNAVRNRLLRQAPFWLLSFLIPAALVLAVMAFLHITPFGDTSVFLWDSKLQYKDYMGFYWDVLHGEASLDYSFGKSLGGGMYGLFAYYLSSPLNLLLFFFSKDSIPLFMAFLIVLRIGLCGVSAFYFLRLRFKLDYSAALLLSTAYALIEYNVYNCNNPMWLDGVIMLPLVASGIWKLVTENKGFLLWFSVGLAIISNWYSAYMVCLMSIICFFFELAASSDFKPFHAIKTRIDVVFKYAIIMALGVLAGMVVLLPACLSLLGGKASNNLSFFSGVVNFDLLHFFSGFDISAAVGRSTDPNIFTSTLVLVFVVLLFCNGAISCRERIVSGAFLLLLVAAFCFHDVELFWTAFVESHSYSFRFAFVFSFFLVCLAARSWIALRNDGISRKGIYVAGGIILAVFALLGVTDQLRSTDAVKVFMLIEIIISLASVYLVFCRVDCGKRCNLLAISSVAVFLICELALNTEIAFSQYKEPASVFSSYENRMETVVDELDKLSDNSFYRFEKTDSYLSLLNPPYICPSSETLMYGYAGIECYTSVYDPRVNTFLSNVGYSDWPDDHFFACETYWNSPVVLMDSILSIRYAAMSQGNYFGYSQLDAGINFPVDGVVVYENDAALPLGFSVSNDMGDVVYGENPFENQERFVQAMLGNENVEPYADADMEYLGYENGIERWNIQTRESGPLYLYVNGSDLHSNPYADNCSLLVNGVEIQKICTRFSVNVMYLGEFNSGDVIDVTIKHNNTDVEPHAVFAAQLRPDVFSSIIETLAGNSKSSISIDGNTISGSFYSAEPSTIFLSIPYDDGWQAYVDGNPVSIKELGQTFMGIEVSAGSHEIKLVYTTPGLHLGAGLSLAGVVGFVLFDRFVLVKKRGECSGASIGIG